MAEALPFLKGTLDILVLNGLAWTPMHGFELTRWLVERSGATFEIDEAAVYQSLYRMEAKRFVAAEWAVSDKGRRARYYRITTSGREHLRHESVRWRRYAEVVAGILDTAPRDA
jgi:transcriptional regulator